ncbi:MAG: hypothetical protein ACLTSZ_06510 [Lachnospiraceae bacterium]
MCQLLTPALGTVGTGVFLVILSIICVITHNTALDHAGMKNQSKKMYRSAKESSARRREAYAREREQMEQQELTLEQMDLSPDPARADAYVPFAEKPEKRRGLFGRKAESRTVIETRRGCTERSPEVVTMPEHAQGPKEGKEQVASHRTKLEVPVIFPSTPQPSRHSRKRWKARRRISGSGGMQMRRILFIRRSRQPTAKPEVGLHIEGLEKSRREVSSDVIFGKAELPQSNPVQEKTAQSALYRADMSELQSDAFADDLSTDQKMLGETRKLLLHQKQICFSK